MRIIFHEDLLEGLTPKQLIHFFNFMEDHHITNVSIISVEDIPDKNNPLMNTLTIVVRDSNNVKHNYKCYHAINFACSNQSTQVQK